MRFYTKQHPLYCGSDLHARTMSVCVLNQDGAMLGHRHMPAGPAPLLQAVAPYRTDLGVCVEGLFPWSWRAALCARAGLPCVRGPALYRKALHGGKATNDPMDAQNIARLRRGAMLPQASVYPAAMRATRDLRRRRRPLGRQRAELYTHVQPPHSPYPWPALGTKRAYTTNRPGVAERWAAPAGPKSVEVDLALLDDDDPRRRDRALAMGKTAKQHEANPLSLLPTVPGIGKILRLVLLSARHDSARFPRVKDFVSYRRLVQCAQESAGKRSGTAGTPSGTADLTRACSAAAVLGLRHHPAGHKSRAR